MSGTWRAAAATFTAACLLVGCGGGPSDQESRSSPTPTVLPEDVTEAPPVETGALGGGGGGSGRTGAAGDEDDAAIVVSGPTLLDDYSDYWGNILDPSRVSCGGFSADSAYDVTIVTVSAAALLELVDCSRLGSGNRLPRRLCAAGLVLAAENADSCRLGMVFGSGVDPTANYELTQAWEFSLQCTDVADTPCSDPEVVAGRPTRADPVEVRWTQVFAVRYCGATGYTGGDTSPPDGGCTQSTATDGPTTPPGPTDQPPDTPPAQETTPAGGDP